MSAQAVHPATTRYKRTLTAELLLVTEIQIFILIARLPAHAGTTLLVDGALLFGGLVATVFLLARKASGWFVLCGVAPILAGLSQLFWSFGAETAFFMFVSILIGADMIANLILLGIALWKGRETSSSP